MWLVRGRMGLYVVGVVGKGGLYVVGKEREVVGKYFAWSVCGR